MGKTVTTLKLGKAVHSKSMPDKLINGKWVDKIDEREVRVMAVAEGYAMVRRKGAIPYVCPVKEIVQ
jgi:hypothetical protein